MADGGGRIETVLGVEIEVLGKRRLWPEAVRRAAMERVEAGVSVIDVARQMGTSPSVIHRWQAALRKAGRPSAAPAFLEIRPVGAAPFVKEVAPAAPVVSTGTCTIRLPGADIVVDAAFPVDRMAAIVAALRGGS